MSQPKIVAFAGSLRTESYNKKLIAIAAESARAAGAEVTLVDLRDLALPLFDQDIEHMLDDLVVEHAGDYTQHLLN